MSKIYSGVVAIFGTNWNKKKVVEDACDCTEEDYLQIIMENEDSKPVGEVKGNYEDLRQEEVTQARRSIEQHLMRYKRLPKNCEMSGVSPYAMYYTINKYYGNHV